MSDEGFGDVSKSVTPVETIVNRSDMKTPQKPDLDDETPRPQSVVDAEEVDDDGRDVPTWKALLLDYTQNATLHGVRYITTTTQFSLRR